MNFYLVVEGGSEKAIYKSWIPIINPQLRVVSSILDVDQNSVFIVSAMGYPQYFEVIENAISDVKTNTVFDRLVIAIDSEEFSKQEKYDEVQSFVSGVDPSFHADIIVQHFCIETWALGHPTIFPRTNGSEKFQEYRAFHNVMTNDPELLPAYPKESLNRAKFAAKYLRTGLNSRSPTITYSKNKPDVICAEKYLKSLKRRIDSTSHISSMEAVFKIFS